MPSGGFFYLQCWWWLTLQHANSLVAQITHVKCPCAPAVSTVKESSSSHLKHSSDSVVQWCSQQKREKRDEGACVFPRDDGPVQDSCLAPFCCSQPVEGNPSVPWHLTGMTSPFFLWRNTTRLAFAVQVCVTGKALLFCHLLLAAGPEKISTVWRSF